VTIDGPVREQKMNNMRGVCGTEMKNKRFLS